MPLETLNILPILDWFTKIDDLLRSINRKLDYLEKPVCEVVRVENVNVPKGVSSIAFADVSRFKTKTVTIRLDTPMDILIYMYDREYDIDYDDPYMVIDSSEVTEDRTITFTITDIFNFMRVVVNNEYDDGVVKVCTIKCSVT